MKFCTLIVFDLLSPNLPGAKADSQWGRRIRHFKMAATPKNIFSLYWSSEIRIITKNSEVLDITDAYLIVTTTKTDIVENTRWPPFKNISTKLNVL